MRRDTLPKIFNSCFLLILLLAGCVNYSPNYNNNYMIEHKKLVSYNDKLPIFTITEKPDLQAGDSFVFDDGSVETVVGKYGNMVEWLSSGGVNFITSENPILHYSAWAYEKRYSDKNIIDINYNVPDNFMWPLSLFNEKSFIASEGYARGRILFSDSYNVKCKIEDISKIKTEIGSFDTFAIACSTGLFGGETMRYYSPELGFFAKIVTRKGIFSAKTKTLKSCSIDVGFLSEDDNDMIAKTIESALDYGPKDGGFIKYLNNSKIKVSVLLDEVQNVEGKNCANFTRVLDRGYCHSIVQGNMCKMDNGHWKSSKKAD